MPIKLDDPNALEQLTEKLSKRRQLQEMMKEVNAVIRSSKSDDAKIDFIMKKCGKSREEARNFLHPSESWCDPGFAAWELANNNQEIGRLRKRILEVERYREAAARAEEEGNSEFPFNGGRIVDNIPANRLQIFFDGKPDADVRTRLKRNGFRWAPMLRSLAKLPARIYARLGQTGIQCRSNPMTRVIHYRELMFDPTVPGCFRPLTRQEIQKQRLPKPEPVDVFRNDPREKLWLMNGLPDPDGCLAYALDSIRHFFYGDRDKLSNILLRHDSRHDCGIDLYYEMSNYLLEREAWCRLLETEQLHVCFDEFVRPLREYIAELFQQIEIRREQAV